MDEIADRTVVPNLALNVPSDERMCVVTVNEELSGNDSQPGSGQQQRNKSSQIGESDWNFFLLIGVFSVQICLIYAPDFGNNVGE